MNRVLIWIMLGIVALIVYVMIPANRIESFGDYPSDVEQLMEIVRNTPDVKKPVEKPEPLTPEMENLLKVLKAAGRDIPTGESNTSTKSQPAGVDATGPNVSPSEQQGQIARNTVSAPASPAQVVVVPVQLKSSDVSPAIVRQQIKDEIQSEIKRSTASNPNIPNFNRCPPPAPAPTCPPPKPVCPPPKPACPPPKPACPPKPPKCKCPPMPDMSDYIRKDSIPCWACKI